MKPGAAQTTNDTPAQKYLAQLNEIDKYDKYKEKLPENLVTFVQLLLARENASQLPDAQPHDTLRSHQVAQR